MDISVSMDDLAALADLANRAPKSPAEERYLIGLVKQFNLKAQLAQPLPVITPDEPPPAPEPVLQS